MACQAGAIISPLSGAMVSTDQCAREFFVLLVCSLDTMHQSQLLKPYGVMEALPKICKLHHKFSNWVANEVESIGLETVSNNTASIVLECLI